MIFAALCLFAPSLPTIIPAPLSYNAEEGSVRLDAKTIIVADADARPVAERLREELRPATGWALPIHAKTGKHAISLIFDNTNASYGPEGYRLETTDDGVNIIANTQAGLFYGVQTLRQMLPVQAFDRTVQHDVEWNVPRVKMFDKPRFPWRGMHLDVSRHFEPMSFIERFIDWLAVHKMNVFHWHLVDDGGWRIEIKKYPKLTDVGAWRVQQPVKWDYSNLHFPGKNSGQKMYGGFYTQDEIRKIVKYAQDRYITIVPEIEMPGHSTELVASYPELGCSPSAEIKAKYIAGTGNDQPSMVCAGKPAVREFYKNVLTEVMGLFPSKFIHIGGDEVPKDLWAQCPDCQTRKKAKGLKTEEELQSDFIRDMDSFLVSKGRRLIGWDEILEGGLADNAAVMSWRGISGGIAAAQAGKDVVMSPTSHCYFDFSYASTSTEHVYSYEPIPTELSEAQAKHVLGAQANIWTEWIATPQEVERMMFPRAAALAEAVWTEPTKKDWADFSRRLVTHYQRLDRLGINYYVEAPVAKSDLVLVGSHEQVAFENPPVSGATIRYTMDGTVPTASSPTYSGPIPVTKPAVIKAAIFRPGGAMSEVTTISAVSIQPDTTPKKPGVSWRVIEGNFKKCPEPSAFSGVSSKNVSEISVGDHAGKDHFAVMVEGFIRIPTDGEFTFYLGSDDGSKMWIDGNLVIDNDGPHGYAEKRLKMRLPAGDYPFRIVMYEGDGAESLKLWVEGAAMPKSQVPSSMLWSK